MPLFNVYLENDKPDHFVEDILLRKENWNTEVRIVETTATTDDFSNGIKKFVEDFIDPKWLTASNLPKDQLAISFALNKKVLEKIISTDGCEGIRIVLSTKNALFPVIPPENNPDGTTKTLPLIATNIVVRPIDAKLNDIIDDTGSKHIFFSDESTQCPPQTPCPGSTFKRYCEFILAGS